MNENFSVALLGDAEGEILARLETSRAGLTVVRSCATVSELLGTAHTGIADAALIIDSDEELTGTTLHSLTAQGMVIVLMVSGEEAENPFDLVTVSRDASAEVIAEAVALAASPETVWKGALEAAEAASSPAAPDAAPPRSETLEPEEPAGLCWTVWGPLGAPGVSTVALNLAAEAAHAGLRTCLIDANTYAASLAAMLGLLDESSGLSRACRAAERGRLDGPGLEQLCETVRIGPHGLHVLTGLTRAERWIEIRETALSAVIDAACRRFDRVVIDAGFCLEREEESVYDFGAAQRNAAALTAVEQAQSLLCVGRADVLGVPRLIKAMEEAELLRGSAEVWVLLNHLPTGARAEGLRAELLQAWERFGPSTPIRALLPSDPAAAADALTRGSALTEGFRRSPLRQAIQQLWRDLDPQAEQAPEAPAPRAGRRLRALGAAGRSRS